MAEATACKAVHAGSIPADASINMLVTGPETGSWSHVGQLQAADTGSFWNTATSSSIAAIVERIACSGTGRLIR